MKPIAEHRAKLKEIIGYAFNYGFGAMQWEGAPLPPSEWSNELFQQFYEKCNEGYKLAQELLLEERIAYQQQLRDAVSRQKVARGQRLKEEEKNIGQEIAVFDFRLSALTHIADGIAWTILGGQIHLARRLHMQETEQKFLDTSNVDHAIRAAAEINANPLNFALLADLTGIVQIGDLLVRRPTSIETIELKEGGVNDKITKLFDAAEQSGKSLSDVDLSSFDPKTTKQAQRMIRQREKKANAEGVMSNDVGTDPVTKLPIVVSTPTVTTETYLEQLLELRSKLRSETAAYACIEGCLHIGMYRDRSILTTAPIAIELTLEQLTKHSILIDWMDIANQVSEPIFAKGFDEDFVLDFLTGQVKVVMGLDVDALMRNFNYFGLQADWMTTKETGKFTQAGLARQLVEFDNKGIGLKFPGEENRVHVLSWGIISKILFDNILPSSIVSNMLHSERPKLPGVDDEAPTP